MEYYSYDEYYDYDMLPESSEDIEYDTDQVLNYFVGEEEVKTQTLAHAFETCVQPSVSQTSSYIVALIGCGALWRFVWLFARRQAIGDWLIHFSSVACGFTVLCLTTGHEFLIVLFLSLMSYVLMRVVEYYQSRNMGIFVGCITIGMHFLYELCWQKPEAWQRIRGLQMVATMKIVSLAFDLESQNVREEKSRPVPTLMPYLGYVFCPATCVLGPWMPYSVYLRNLRGSSVGGMRFFVWTLLNGAFAVAFLCLSNCFVPLLYTYPDSLWFRTFKDALAVRCSHYFICFLSQASIAASGLNLHADVAPNTILGHMVTKPWSIELPRSLSSLVRCWNIPMHEWLKKYVFRAANKHCGSYLVAVLSTYLVSSLLHGLHMKIYLVLLSLAYFAYVERLLRAKLAHIFDACISATPCRVPCRYTHCPSRWPMRSSTACLVRLINIAFSLIALLHLCYLGVMMSDSASTDITDIATLETWTELKFANHWIALLSYIFYYLI